ncbi:citrate lyase beta subunit [Candidatus Gottesmanbacteria bacterium]|nr:citrate lyase beta subunit [Candidatus Gottesmanbacteria bacterium]
MNALELKMIELLKDLKKHHGVTAVKAEFEAEACRLNEVMRLKDVANEAGLGIILKVGGAEAITDMFHAQHLGVTGLVAPMIESAYAMRKYLMAVRTYFPSDLQKSIHFGVNLETGLAYTNLPDILNEKMIHTLSSITLGRVDMTGSLGLSRDEVNCDQIFEIAFGMFTQARKKKLSTTMGGGIAKEAVPFIRKLARKKLLDYVETRKIVFSVSKALKSLELGIVKANRFELLWLESKRQYYASIYHEDEKRMTMLSKRIR